MSGCPACRCPSFLTISFFLLKFLNVRFVRCAAEACIRSEGCLQNCKPQMQTPLSFADFNAMVLLKVRVRGARRVPLGNCKDRFVGSGYFGRHYCCVLLHRSYDVALASSE